MTTSEQRLTFPGWRIFIFGLEVSLNTSDLSWNWTDEKIPNTAQFRLSNLDDRYTITENDLDLLYGDIPLDELAFSSIFGDIDPEQVKEFAIHQFTLNRIKSSANEEGKKLVLAQKFDKRQKGQIQVVDPYQEEGTGITPALNATTELLKLKNFASQKGDFLRFPFYNGHPIFHVEDPITVFLRDPYNPDIWVFGGRGKMTNWSEEIDKNGAKSLTITMQCPLRDLQKSRCQTNWSIFDYSVVVDKDVDFAYRSFFQENFFELTVPELMYTYIFGLDQAGKKALELVKQENGAISLEDKTPGVITFDFRRYGAHAGEEPIIDHVHQFGIGLFNRKHSEIYILGNDDVTAGANPNDAFVNDKNPVRLGNNELERWQRAIDHIVPTKLVDIEPLCIEKQWPNEGLDYWNLLQTDIDGNYDVQDVMTRIGEHPELYPVDYGRLMMILPSKLRPGDNRDILLRNVAQNMAMQTKFITRLQLIFSIINRLEFSFYCTPRGDLVLEMPFYMNEPEDFGSYADRYTFPIKDTLKHSSAFDESKIRTMMQSSYHVAKNLNIGESKALGFVPGTATIGPLLPMFGIRLEDCEPFGFIASREAASYFASVRLSQCNSNAWTSNVGTVMRVGLGPNRPTKYQVRDFITTTRRVSGNIVWGASGNISQTNTGNYYRAWSGLTKDAVGVDGKASKAKVYETFGGTNAAPIDYTKWLSLDVNPPKESTKSESSSSSANANAENSDNTDTTVKKKQDLLLVNTIAIADVTKQRSTQSVANTSNIINANESVNRELSAAGADYIKRKEGFSTTVYDLNGALHIGYGHKLTPDEIANDTYTDVTLTTAEASTIFDRDILPAQNAVNSVITANLTEGQTDALVSLAFNIGPDAFKKSSHLIDAVNSADDDRAKQVLASFIYYHDSDGNKQISNGLRIRRAQDVKVYDGIYR